ncbi:hypothetical protein G6F57_011910 [Rhizopus arrhizus]|nr:hypothetical protein G6F57_011910 [Rhizopus arrhizus]
MDIVVKEELKAYIDPLTADEHDALERSILAEGCRDALVLWGDVLVDGHNRFGICQKHGLPFNTVQNTRFQSMEDVHLWMIEQHLGRRSVSDFQRGVLALRKRDILAARKQVEQAQLQRESDGSAEIVEDAGEDSPPQAEHQPGRHDRAHPRPGRGRSGASGEGRRDFDQRRRGRGRPARGRAARRRRRRQG